MWAASLGAQYQTPGSGHRDDEIGKQLQRLKIKRVYSVFSVDDGTRVLIDRLWPRGMTRERTAVALWLKDLAPTEALHKWFGHAPSRWEGFRARYRAELLENRAAVERLLAVIKAEPVTLVYGAKNEAHNNAVVLAEHLRSVPP